MGCNISSTEQMAENLDTQEYMRGDPGNGTDWNKQNRVCI